MYISPKYVFGIKFCGKKNFCFASAKKTSFCAGKKHLFKTFFCLFHIDQNNDHLLTKLFAPPYIVDVYARDFFQIILACGNPFFGNGADAPRFRWLFPLFCSESYIFVQLVASSLNITVNFVLINFGS